MVAERIIDQSSLHLPQRLTLISQTAKLLQDSIHRGNWQGKLPAERALCAKYQVSRNTLRAALQRLQGEHIVQCIHGSGNYILAAPPRKVRRLQTNDIALLSPEPLERLRPTQTLWIGELRALLSEQGLQLHVFHQRQCFRNQPERALRRLVAENPHRCWILTLSTPAIQEWFRQNKVRCVVAGSVPVGSELPSCDMDHRAMCRHAVEVLLGQGHRKVALFIGKSQRAGDLESEAGFREGIQQHLDFGAEAIVCQHDSTMEGARQALRQMMSRPSAPTAILVANAHHCLTVTTGLLQLGLRVPKDVSVISRDDDRFLSYIVPEPARYSIEPHVMADSLFRMVLDPKENAETEKREVRLMPELILGSSIAAPAFRG